MGWNYRIVRRKGRTKHGRWTSYGVHEAYYDPPADCDGGPDCRCEAHSISMEPVVVAGGSVKELRDVLRDMLKALDRPVLDFDLIGCDPSVLKPEATAKVKKKK